MPSFADSAIIFVLALLLFGPKKLPELARYVGKLMAEFRRASSEFRLQMEDEFRVIEQAEQQKKIAAIEAAAPVAPLNIPEPEHPHMPLAPTGDAIAANLAAHTAEPVTELNLRPDPSETVAATPNPATLDPAPPNRYRTPDPETAPVAIASNGDLHLMPPATGLPVSRSASSHASDMTSAFDSIPHVADPETEATPHG